MSGSDWVDKMFPSVDNSPLGEEDLFDVLAELMTVVGRWKAIGRGFRINSRHLDNIQQHNCDDCEECLSGVLTCWLRKNYDVERFGEPTWRTVVKVVAHSAAGNDYALARSIAERHLASSQALLVATQERVHPPRASSFVVIERSDLDIGDKLGGEVYKSRWKSRSLTVAVKRLNGKLEEGEASKLGSMRHRNIVFFYGIVMQAPDYWMVTEYAENGSLFEFLQQNGFNLERNLKWAKEIAQGLHYLHCEAPESIIHGDLKSSNVLLTSTSTVKICDFGSARKYYQTTNKTILGTYPWTAPEVHEKKASISCDVFSYGVVLWELITHQKPFDGLEGVAVANKIMSGERPPIPDGCPPYLADLMRGCWKHDPKQRPKSSDILDVLHRKNAVGETHPSDPPSSEIELATTPATPPQYEFAMANFKRRESSPYAPNTAKKPREFDGKPTVSDLTLIKWKAGTETRRLRIIDAVCTKWETIGNILGIPPATLEMWMQTSHDPKKCCNSVFRFWFQNPPKEYPLTWDGFIELLEDVPFKELAHDLKEALIHRV